MPEPTVLQAGNVRSRSPLKAFSVDAAGYGVATVGYLLLTAVMTFAVPRLYTIQAFGTYRLFLLYGSFVGVLHFGILDGALVRWSQRPDLVSLEFMSTAKAVVLIAGASVSVALAICILISGTGSFVFGLGLAALGVIATFCTTAQFALQALKRFGTLSVLNLLSPALLLVLIWSLADWGAKSSTPLLLAYLGVALAIAYISYKTLRSSIDLRAPELPNSQLLEANYSIGGFILLANFASTLLLGMDRLLVSHFFPLEHFAIYSFAASILFGANTLVVSVGRVSFPHLCGFIDDLHTLSRHAASVIVVAWSLSLILFFLLASLIRSELPRYEAAIPLIRILVLATGPAAMVQVVHFARFRAERLERRLLLGASLGLIASAGALIVAKHFGTLTAVAWAAVVGHFAWWCANEFLMVGGRLPSSTYRNAFVMVVIGFLFLSFSETDSLRNALFYLVAAGLTGAVILAPEFVPFLRFITAQREVATDQ